MRERSRRARRRATRVSGTAAGARPEGTPRTEADPAGGMASVMPPAPRSSGPSAVRRRSRRVLRRPRGADLNWRRRHTHCHRQPALPRRLRSADRHRGLRGGGRSPLRPRPHRPAGQRQPDRPRTGGHGPGSLEIDGIIEPLTPRPPRLPGTHERLHRSWSESVVIRCALTELGARTPVVPALTARLRPTAANDVPGWPSAHFTEIINDMADHAQVILYSQFRRVEANRTYGVSGTGLD